MKTSIFMRLLAGAIVSVIILSAFTTEKVISHSGYNKTMAIKKISTKYTIGDVLNQNLRVTYAVDNGNDITEQLNDWTFRFNGNHPAGEAQAWNDILSSTGSWSMAEGASEISIAYPSTLSQLVFMSRTWTIGQAGKGPEIIFTASDGDEVHFISDVQ